MAQIELVTSHQGSPHVTVDQVRDLFAGLSGDISGVKVFSNLDNAFDLTIESSTSVRIATGQALASGFFFQLLESYLWELDPGLVGYSRIDSLYVVIYEDDETLIQTADFVYQPGALYVNGTTGTVPSPPSGETVKEAFELVRVVSTDGAIVSVEGKFTYYLNNESLLTQVSDTIAQVDENTEALNNFRFGIDQQGRYGYYKVGADTVTPFRTANGNATAADVRDGMTFSNAESDNIVGTMTYDYERTITAYSFNEPVTTQYYDLNRYVGRLRVDVLRQ